MPAVDREVYESREDLEDAIALLALKVNAQVRKIDGIPALSDRVKKGIAELESM